MADNRIWLVKPAPLRPGMRIVADAFRPIDYDILVADWEFEKEVAYHPQRGYVPVYTLRRKRSQAA